MKNAEPGSEQHQWGEAIKVIRPVFATDGGGTHVNISGAAVARHAPNRDNAVALMEYLVSDEAQGLYARANYEYPVKAGVELDPVVASFGEMPVDPLPLTEVVRHRREASVLVAKAVLDHSGPGDHRGSPPCLEARHTDPRRAHARPEERPPPHARSPTRASRRPPYHYK